MIPLNNILKGFTILLITFFNYPYYYTQTILENGGFEDGQGNWSTYFETSGGYNGNLTITSSNVHSGDNAAKISITQVPVNPQVLKAQLKNNLFHILAVVRFGKITNTKKNIY